MVRSALQHCSPQAESHECLWKRQVPTAPTVVRGRSSSRDERRVDAYTRNVAWEPSALVHRRIHPGLRHLRLLQSPHSHFHHPLPIHHLSRRGTFGARQVLNQNASRIATNAHPIPKPKNTMNTIAVACLHRSRGDSTLTGPSKEISRSISDSLFTVRVMARARLCVYYRDCGCHCLYVQRTEP